MMKPTATLLLLAAALLALLAPSHANFDNMPFKVVVKDCNGHPVENVKVELSGCVWHENPDNAVSVKTTDEYGYAVWNATTATDWSTDNVHYCWNAAGNKCTFKVLDGENYYTTFVTPDSPKALVRDTCKCNVCWQFKKTYAPDCPATVPYPGCINPGQAADHPQVIVLQRTNCPKFAECECGNKFCNDNLCDSPSPCPEASPVDYCAKAVADGKFYRPDSNNYSCSDLSPCTTTSDCAVNELCVAPGCCGGGPLCVPMLADDFCSAPPVVQALSARAVEQSGPMFRQGGRR